ncbi:S8 family serine peptidase [Nonomuraea africana]|uniref:S8 family serine peptidase n=1 Tax=Nonomuraea africana TaxID=46171 RepID=UPI0033EAD265
MLTRTLLMAVPLVLASVPASAHADGQPVVRMAADFAAAQRITMGEGARVAIIGDAVANARALNGAVRGRLDLVKWPRATMLYGTAQATMLAASGPRPGAPTATRGLVPEVELLSVRVEPFLADFGSNRTKHNRWYERNRGVLFLASGIRWAANHGADVIWTTTSWEGGDTRLADAVAYAAGKGAVVVAPAWPAPRSWGIGVNGVYDPHGLPGVIGVGVVDLNGSRLEEYSARNRSVLLSAPGGSLPTTGPRGQRYYLDSGTAASGWVVAAAAMVKAKYPKLAPSLVIQALAATARRPGQQGEGEDIITAAYRTSEPRIYDTSIGFGLVNPAGALKMAGRLAAMKPGKDAVAPGARFGGGIPAQKIVAVRHDKISLTGMAGAIGGGGLLLSLASVAIIRGRRTPNANIETATRNQAGSPPRP